MKKENFGMYLFISAMISFMFLILGYLAGIHDYPIDHPCPPDPYPADGKTYYEYGVYKSLRGDEHGNTFIHCDTIPMDTIWYPDNNVTYYEYAIYQHLDSVVYDTCLKKIVYLSQKPDTVPLQVITFR